MTNIRGNKGCQTYFYEVIVCEKHGAVWKCEIAQDNLGELLFYDIHEAMEKRDELNKNYENAWRKYQCERVDL